MHDAVVKLPNDQQEAIRQALQSSQLIDKDGNIAPMAASTLSDHHREALHSVMDTMGMQQDLKISGNAGVCAAAHIAESVAIVACTKVPGGQSAVDACFATAHAIANQVCSRRGRFQV
jgi:hypothetical protein